MTIPPGRGGANKGCGPTLALIVGVTLVVSAGAFLGALGALTGRF